MGTMSTMTHPDFRLLDRAHLRRQLCHFEELANCADHVDVKRAYLTYVEHYTRLLSALEDRAGQPSSRPNCAGSAFRAFGNSGGLRRGVPFTSGTPEPGRSIVDRDISSR